MLKLTSRREGDLAVLEVGGPLDIYTATHLRLACLGLENETHPCVDLSDVSFMDTVGLGVLIAFQRRAQRREHHLALIDPPGHVFDLLKAVGLDEEFAIYPTCSAAQRAVHED